MLTVVSRRPGSSSLQTSPTKRVAAHSPQNRRHNASPTSFHSRPQEMHLSELAATIPKLGNILSSSPPSALSVDLLEEYAFVSRPEESLCTVHTLEHK